VGHGGRQPGWSGPVRLTFDDGLQTEPSLSADGQTVAYAADVGGNFDIWTRRLAGGNPVRVTTAPADDWQPDWSPDGETLVFRSERGAGGIFVVPATGGAEEKVVDFGFRPLWAPDGKHIVFARSILTGANSLLCVITPDGQTLRNVPSEVPGAFGWHADSRHIFLLTSLAGPFIPQARTIDIQEGHWTNWTVRDDVARRFLATKLWVARSRCRRRPCCVAPRPAERRRVVDGTGAVITPPVRSSSPTQPRGQESSVGVDRRVCAPPRHLTGL
jgi:Tol biopolymer transport system component